MESVFAKPERIEYGTSVGLICYEDGQPHVVTSTFIAHSPITLSVPHEFKNILVHGQRILLVIQSESDFSKADGTIASIKPTGEGLTVTIENINWERVDRRRYPRYKVNVPVQLKLVVEQDGVAEIKFINSATWDLSLGGAWLETEGEISQGHLVEFQAHINGGKDSLKILSMVAWSDPSRKGTGLEFIDFIGNSRYNLHDFLSKAA